MPPPPPLPPPPPVPPVGPPPSGPPPSGPPPAGPVVGADGLVPRLAVPPACAPDREHAPTDTRQVAIAIAASKRRASLCMGHLPPQTVAGGNGRRPAGCRRGSVGLATGAAIGVSSRTLEGQGVARCAAVTRRRPSGRLSHSCPRGRWGGRQRVSTSGGAGQHGGRVIMLCRERDSNPHALSGRRF